MHRIDSYGATEDGTYTNGVPNIVPATVADANAMNAIQEELCYLVTRPPYSGTLLTSDEETEAGDAPWTQVGTALDARYGQLAEPNTWADTQTFEEDGAGWITIPLNTAGNWTALSDETTDYQPKYRVDSFGRVWLRGYAIRTSGSATTIGTLPVGARPIPARGYFVATVAVDGSQPATLQIINDGRIIAVAGVPAGATNVTLAGAFYP